jgi:hypothetical protein
MEISTLQARLLAMADERQASLAGAQAVLDDSHRVRPWEERRIHAATEEYNATCALLREAAAAVAVLRGPEADLKVATVIDEGNLDVTEGETIQDVLDTAARALDKGYAHEISGSVLFKATDGKYYVAATEIAISEASPELLRDRLLEQIDEFCICEDFEDTDSPHDEGCPARELAHDYTRIDEQLRTSAQAVSL